MCLPVILKAGSAEYFLFEVVHSPQGDKNLILNVNEATKQSVIVLLTIFIAKLSQ